METRKIKWVQGWGMIPLSRLDKSRRKAVSPTASVRSRVLLKSQHQSLHLLCSREHHSQEHWSWLVGSTLCLWREEGDSIRQGRLRLSLEAVWG